MMKIEVESNYFCFQKLTRCKVEYKCILLKANINLRKKALLVEHWNSLEIVKLEYVNDWMVHFSDKASRMKKNIYMYICMYIYVCMNVCMYCMYACMYVCMYVSGPWIQSILNNNHSLKYPPLRSKSFCVYFLKVL